MCSLSYFHTFWQHWILSMKILCKLWVVAVVIYLHQSYCGTRPGRAQCVCIYIYYMLLVYITEYVCTKAFPEKNSVSGVGQVVLTRCLSGFFCKLRDCKHGCFVYGLCAAQMSGYGYCSLMVCLLVWSLIGLGVGQVFAFNFKLDGGTKGQRLSVRGGDRRKIICPFIFGQSFQVFG